MHDPISNVVYTGSQQNVDTVVVDGEVVLDAGRFPHIDEAAFVREVHERSLALAQRVGTFRLMRGRRFTPFAYDRVGIPEADRGVRPEWTTPRPRSRRPPPATATGRPRRSTRRRRPSAAPRRHRARRLCCSTTARW